MNFLSAVAAAIACAGLVQAAVGACAALSFQKGIGPLRGGAMPPVTILKPLFGDEPMLEAALASVCDQDYGEYQVVFGLQDPRDEAIEIVARLRARFPHRDIALVVNDTSDGKNRKVANLVNMLPAAKHEILVIADSDVHCARDYLARIARAFDAPGTGLVTTLYSGLPSNGTLAAGLGATGITHGFLPGALMARWLGRQDCLGATMALRRETLAAIGGFPKLLDHLADDHVLGKAVQALGLKVRLAGTVAATTVPETTLATLFQHELRWSRTILSLEPLGFVLWTIQFPLFWAALAIGLSGAARWSVLLFASAWLVRAATARAIDLGLGLAKSGLASRAPIWLLPLRDIMSITVILASYGSDRVEWRGRVISTGRAPTPGPVADLASPAFSPPAFSPPAYAPPTYAPVRYAGAERSSVS